MISKKSVITQTIISLIFLVVSCSEKEEVLPQNYFKYKGNTYPLSKGFITEIGMNFEETVMNFDVFLFSSGINLNTGAGRLFIGSGHGVDLEFNSSDLAKLAPGVYQWDDWLSNESEKLIFGRMFLNYDSQASTITFSDATNGSAKVTQSGSEIIIDFQLEIDGQPLTGRFQGTLQKF